MSAGIVFDLIGNDKSVSSALEGVKESGKKAAGAVGAAFAGLAIGDIITKSFDNEKVLAKFKAGLGQTPAIAKQAGDLAGKVFRDGIGSSLEDVTNAVGDIGTQMMDLGNTSPADLEKITKGALNIAEVMGVDVVDVTKAAGQMMKNGLAPDAMTAFDIIATGAQNGANKSGDLLDTLNEYSPHFAKLGIDGTTALGMIKAGMDAGIFTTDLAADAMKEFAIRVVDGSKSTREALMTIGMIDGTDENQTIFQQRLAAGGESAKLATGEIMTALSNMTDPLAQQSAGVALFGTQWEDSGAKAVLSMNPVTIKTTEVKDATKNMGDTLNDTAQNKVDKMKRSFDGWTQSMVETKGWVGNVTAAAIAFGPTAISMAGSVSMIVVGLKALGVSSAGAITAATVPLWPLAAAIAAIGVVIKTALDNADRLKGQWDALMRGDWGTAASIRSPAATFGVGSWLNPVNPPSPVTAANSNSRGGGPGGLKVFGDGGIVDEPTFALIGERGEREYVIPESKMGRGGGGGNTTNIFVGFPWTPTEVAAKMHDLATWGARQGQYAVFGQG